MAKERADGADRLVGIARPCERRNEGAESGMMRVSTGGQGERRRMPVPGADRGGVEKADTGPASSTFAASVSSVVYWLAGDARDVVEDDGQEQLGFARQTEDDSAAESGRRPVEVSVRPLDESAAGKAPAVSGEGKDPRRRSGRRRLEDHSEPLAPPHTAVP